MKRAIPSAAAGLQGYDLVVIGTGPVGATGVRTVLELYPQARILMVDAGPQLTALPGTNTRNIHDREAYSRAKVRSQGPTQYSYTTPDLRARADATDPSANVSSLARPGTYLIADGGAGGGMPAAAASTNVGGMGAHWTCACPRAGDREVMPILEEAELNRLYTAAEHLLHVTKDVFVEGPESAALKSRLAGMFDAQLGGRKVQRMPLACSSKDGAGLVWTGSDTILGLLADPLDESIELWSETICRRVIFEDGHAVAAICEDLSTGLQCEVRASTFLLACDALRTPQLLWASGIRPRALGRYLNDQPQIVSVVRVFGIDQPVRELGVFWVPYSDPTHPFHGQIMQMETSPIALAENASDAGEAETLLTLGWFCAKEVRFEDCVAFSEEMRDYLGMPAPMIHYGLSVQDLKHIQQALEIVTEVATELGECLPGYEPRMIPAGSSLHYQGSTRMGTSAEDSVCDRYSRVWGFDNLFVGGNGVIATSTACNPTLTSCALVIRAAGEIVRLLKESLRNKA